MCNCFDVACAPCQSVLSPCSSVLGLGRLSALLFVVAPHRLGVPSRPSSAGRLGVRAIRGYQRWLSPRLPVRCRYSPSCSAYGLTVVDRFGLVTGGRLAAARIARCRCDVPMGTVDEPPVGR
ncbi:membrane protein insertion efficiency factor YidD [Dactylosporangium sp. NPDC051484]|uniref:membrane protein insertion efficiency factor YidD n=1 Tax=Dactylosporangium sp. NPDC051484 TaxID=3154942 RepID=UPI0034508A6F